jgi:uncharacterized protein (DUF433 family)
MTTPITIVDRGRGPQLSTSRITVQDLVPYFQEGCSYDEIIEWIPILTPEEIRVIEHYIEEHNEEVAETDRRIRERAATRRILPRWRKFFRRAVRSDERSLTSCVKSRMGRRGEGHSG